jgi:hypothetical protein
MEIANPWLYYPALVTLPIWAALMCAGIAKGLDWCVATIQDGRGR